jgi:catechol 2,3-dioxygenase-like lactoylglutathione lyase family enzyme
VLIRHVTLASRDPAAQASFWGGELGLPVARSADGSARVGLARTTVEFAPAGDDVTPGYHFAIAVPSGRIADARAWIERRAALLPFGDGEVQIRFEAIGADSVYFLDPEGNDVELMAWDSRPGEDDGAAFGPSHLLDVSEIGLSAADVAGTREAVCAALGASVFWGGRSGGGLCAVGDQFGAVLIAPEGRGWIPIDLPARPLPTTVVACGGSACAATLPEGPYRIETVTCE